MCHCRVKTVQTMRIATALLIVLLAHSPLRAAEIVRIPVEAGRQKLRLLVAGDLHGDGAKRIASEVARLWRENKIDAVVITGDNFEGCGATGLNDPAWAAYRPLVSIGVPLLPVLGNHDYGNPKRRFGRILTCGSPDPESQVRFSRSNHAWRFPARQYIVSTAVADFIMSDTSPVAVGATEPLFGSATADAVRTFIYSSLARSTAPWRIVVGHHNIDQSGVKRWKSAGTRARMAEHGQMLREAGADLYISGHQHQLELLAPTSRAPLQLISGVAFRPKEPERLTPREPHSLFAATVRNDSAGFAILEVDAQELRISFHEIGRPMPLRQFRAKKVNDRLVVTQVSESRAGSAAAAGGVDRRAVRAGGGSPSRRAE